MSHQLVLDLPDGIYDPLAESARRRGAKPEDVALEWLTAVSRHASRDPVEKFIGAVTGAVADWTEQHDQYLGQGLTEPQARRNEED